MYRQTSLNQKVAAQIIEPAEVIDFSGALHVICGLDCSINRVAWLKLVNLTIHQMIWLIFAMQTWILMNSQFLHAFLGFIEGFSFICKFDFISILIKNRSYSAVIFYKARNDRLL